MVTRLLILLLLPLVVHGQWATQANRRRFTCGYPANVPGLVALWKAESVPAIDAQSIDVWVDCLYRNEAAASTTARPTYKTAIFGNKPVARFDGSSDTMLLSTTITLRTNTGWSVIACWAYNGGAGTRYLIARPAVGAGGIRIDVSAAQRFIFDGVLFPSSNLPGATGTNPLMGTFAYTGSTCQFREATSSLGNNQGALGLNIDIAQFGSQNSAAFFLGDLAEIMFYNRALTDAEMDGMYLNYLKPKYSIP